MVKLENYLVLLNITEPNKLLKLSKILKYKYMAYKIPKTQHQNMYKV